MSGRSKSLRNKINITPEMMAAGVAAMWSWYESDAEPAAAVRPIYEAMMKASNGKVCDADVQE